WRTSSGRRAATISDSRTSSSSPTGCGQAGSASPARNVRGSSAISYWPAAWMCSTPASRRYVTGKTTLLGSLRPPGFDRSRFRDVHAAGGRPRVIRLRDRAGHAVGEHRRLVVADFEEAARYGELLLGPTRAAHREVAGRERGHQCGVMREHAEVALAARHL